jgi:hypothetical protein
MPTTTDHEAAAEEFLRLTVPTGGTPQSAEEEERSSERGIHRGMIAGLIQAGRITLAEGLAKLEEG